MTARLLLFFALVRACWRASAPLRHSADPAWIQDDADALRTFLGSATGTRLRALFARTAVEKAMAATSRATENLAFGAGSVTGYREALAELEMLTVRPLSPLPPGTMPKVGATLPPPSDDSDEPAAERYRP